MTDPWQAHPDGRLAPGLPVVLVVTSGPVAGDLRLTGICEPCWRFDSSGWSTAQPSAWGWLGCRRRVPSLAFCPGLASAAPIPIPIPTAFQFGFLGGIDGSTVALRPSRRSTLGTVSGVVPWAGMCYADSRVESDPVCSTWSTAPPSPSGRPGALRRAPCLAFCPGLASANPIPIPIPVEIATQIPGPNRRLNARGAARLYLCAAHRCWRAALDWQLLFG